MEQRIEFNEADHTYVVDGVPCPSVTTVLDPLQVWDNIPPRMLEEARIFGQHVHVAADLLIRGALEWSALSPALVRPMEGVRNFLTDSGFIPISSEVIVGCAKRRVAGRLDVRGLMRRAEAVIDWKATAALPRTVGPQTAGYDDLYRAPRGINRPQKRFCVQLGEQFSRGYLVHALTDPRDIHIFNSALNIWH